MKKLIVVLLIFALLVPIAMAKQDEKVEPIVAPDNPAFTEYIKNGGDAGYVPSPVDREHLKGKKIKVSDAIVMEGFPVTYDLRTLGKTTSVKDQGSCGSCWAFAAIGSLESVLTPEQWDFSENNLKNLAGFDLAPCVGGNHDMAAAYLNRWSGPVQEKYDPYSLTNPSPANLPVEKHAQEFIYVPVRAGPLDNDNLKAALMTYGGIYSAFYYTGSSYNAGTQSYYYNGATTSSNHAIVLAGWNDGWAASNFNPVAPGPGAFIAKNSWGQWWGDKGYFYISYYDTRLATDNAVFTGESVDTYNKLYQYDPLGWTSTLGWDTDTSSFANTFTATGDDTIQAIGIYTPQTNSVYEVSIYRNPTIGPLNNIGPEVTTAGTITNPGYHTVVLPSSIDVTTGDVFAVVVKLQTPGYNYQVALESNIAGYSSKATALPGQSWISKYGTNWYDLTTYFTGRNVCIKAYAVSQNPDPTPTPPPTPTITPTPVPTTPTPTPTPTPIPPCKCHGKKCKNCPGGGIRDIGDEDEDE